MHELARGWLDSALDLLSCDGAEACLAHVVGTARVLSDTAFRAGWWEHPIGLVEDDLATAVDALGYAHMLLELGQTAGAEELVALVLRAALGAGSIAIG